MIIQFLWILLRAGAGVELDEWNIIQLIVKFVLVVSLFTLALDRIESMKGWKSHSFQTRSFVVVWITFFWAIAGAILSTLVYLPRWPYDSEAIHTFSDFWMFILLAFLCIIVIIYHFYTRSYYYQQKLHEKQKIAHHNLVKKRHQKHPRAAPGTYTPSYSDLLRRGNELVASYIPLINVFPKDYVKGQKYKGNPLHHNSDVSDEPVVWGNQEPRRSSNPWEDKHIFGKGKNKVISVAPAAMESNDDEDAFSDES